MIFFLMFFSALLLLLSFKKLPTIINPTSVFLVGFVFSFFFCVLFYDDWDMEHFSYETTSLLAISFSIFYVINNARAKRKRFKRLQTLRTFNVNVRFLWFVFFCLLTMLLIRYCFIISITGMDLVSALYAIDQQKFSDEDRYNMPALLQTIIVLSECVGSYFSFVFAQQIILKQKGERFKLLLAIFVMSIVGHALTGSRGGAVQFILTFIICYAVLFVRIKGRRTINVKRFAKLAGGAVLFIYVFVMSAQWLGRDTSELKFLEYVAVYCGAEVKNLDDYITSPMPQPKMFAEYTFGEIYKNTFKYKIEKGEYFNYAGDAFLGNVYTTFMDFVHDFGYLGTFVVVAFMSLLMSTLYIKSMSSKTIAHRNVFDIYTYLYAYLSSGLLLCFFSNRFFSLFTVVLLKKMVTIALISYIVNKFFNKRKTYRIKSNKNYGKIIIRNNSNLQYGKISSTVSK